MKKIVAVIIGFALLIGAGQAGMLRTDTKNSITGSTVHQVENWFDNLIDVNRITRQVSR